MAPAVVIQDFIVLLLHCTALHCILGQAGGGYSYCLHRNVRLLRLQNQNDWTDCLYLEHFSFKVGSLQKLAVGIVMLIFSVS